jgi:hypothetical protein
MKRHCLTIAALIVFIGLSIVSWAQTPIQVGGTLTIATKSRVKGLSWDSTNSQQDATFGFSVTLPSGNTHCSWFLDGSSTPIAADNNLSSISITIVGAGKHSVTCTSNGLAGPYNGTLTFAAIGGPLTLGVIPASSGPPTFVNDQENVAQPFYIQSFGYAHSSPPTNSLVQLTQDGSAAVMLGQPAGTTETWSYGSLYCPQLAASPGTNYTSITLQADSGSSALVKGNSSTGPSTIACQFNYTDPTDSSLSGSAQDDTTSTPQSAGSTVMMVDQFDAHQPQSASQSSAVPMTPGEENVTTSSTLGFVGTQYSMYLYDQLGQQMPGVWVQERFSSVPTGVLSIEVNSNGTFWITQMPPDTVPAHWNLFPSGVFKWDYLWFTYAIPITFQGATADHQYWAGTKSISSTVAGGIEVGDFTITYSTSGVSQS